MATDMITTEKQAGDISQPENTYQATFVPRFDIWETDDELLLYGDMPGVAADQLDIRFENRELTIHGRVTPRQPGIQYLHSEYGVGDYHRTFTVGEAIDTEKISAEMQGGVLTVHLPKSEKVKPRRIEVKAK